MIQQEKKDHKELIVKTIEHLENIGYTDIKADINGYESPKSFEMKSQNLKITPDIVSKNPNGKVHYVEVGVKTKNPILLKSKWKFLKTLAEIKNRSFQVIAHRGHYGFTDKLINEIESSRVAVRI